MGKEAPQPGVIAQHGVEPEMRHLVALGIDQPGGVGLRADRLPDRAPQMVAERLAQGRAEHEAENIGLDARVAVSVPGGAIRRLNCVMLAIVPLGEPKTGLATMSRQSLSRSRPPSLSSPKSTPEDMCRRSRIGVAPYSLPRRPGHVSLGRIRD